MSKQMPPIKHHVHKEVDPQSTAHHSRVQDQINTPQAPAPSPPLPAGRSRSGGAEERERDAFGEGEVTRTQTIEQERAQLSQRRAELMQRRGEVATMLRSEHVDGAARRELNEELDSLTGEIRSAENELSTLDDVEQSQTLDRRAAALAADDRRRELAGEQARSALEEVARWGTVVENAVLTVAEAVRACQAAEAQARKSGNAAIRGADNQDAFQMACTPLLIEREIADLLADAPKGRFRNDLAFASKVTSRVLQAIAHLPGRSE